MRKRLVKTFISKWSKGIKPCTGAGARGRRAMQKRPYQPASHCHAPHNYTFDRKEENMNTQTRF